MVGSVFHVLIRQAFILSVVNWPGNQVSHYCDITEKGLTTERFLLRIFMEANLRRHINVLLQSNILDIRGISDQYNSLFQILSYFFWIICFSKTHGYIMSHHISLFIGTFFSSNFVFILKCFLYVIPLVVKGINCYTEVYFSKHYSLSYSNKTSA